MTCKAFCALMLFAVSVLAGPIYKDGVLVGGIENPAWYDAVVIDSFRSQAPSYSMGLAYDGKYIWNDEAFAKLFYKYDTLGGLIRNFTPTSGNRDMTFDGQYLYATDWQAAQIHKYDTATCTIIASYTPPFGGKPNGMTWTGRYFWVGEESGRIYQLDTNMTLVRSIPSPSPGGSNPRGLAFDGEDLWVGAQSVGLIFRIDTISGTILEQFTAPSGGLQQGLTWDGRYLWSTGGNNWVYKIDVRLNIEERLADQFARRTGLKLDVWPNPAHGRVNFKANTMPRHGVRIKVLDVSGRVLTSSYQTAGILQLEPGIYFMHLEQGLNGVAKKLVVVD